MARQSLLVVDADQRSLNVLEVSLRNAGYNVAACTSMARALEILEADQPDLILADTELADADGFTFVQRLRESSAWAHIPFMFLSSDGSIESKIRGLELGVQDYLTKPIYIREVVARVGIELARSERDDLAARGGSGSKTRFSGSLSEMSVVDLLQTIEVSRKTGVLYLVSESGERGAVFFDSGAVIHAHVGELKGDDAVYRLLLWPNGSFDLEFRRVREGEQTVELSTQALLMEGMHRLDQWGRLHEQLPSPQTVLEVDGDALRESLQDLPDETNDLLRLLDGERTLEQALQERGGDCLDTLRSLVDLYFEGIVREAGSETRSIAVVADVHELDAVTLTGGGQDTIPGPGGVVSTALYEGFELTAPAAYGRNHKPTAVGFQFAAAPAGAELGVRSDESALPASIPSPLKLGATTADAIPAAAASRKPAAPAAGGPAGRELDHTPLTVGSHQVDEGPWAEASEEREEEPVLRSSRPPQALDRKQLVLDSYPPARAIRDEPSDRDWLAAEHGPAPSPEHPAAEGRGRDGVGEQAFVEEPQEIGAGAGALESVLSASRTSEADGIDTVAAESLEVREDQQSAGSELHLEERETMELRPLDATLSSLRDDRQVSAALEAISSGHAPTPFVRSSPPVERDASPSSSSTGTASESVSAEAAGMLSEPQPDSEREPNRRLLVLAALVLLSGAVAFSLLLRPSGPESQSELDPEQEKVSKETETPANELVFEPETVRAEKAQPVEDALVAQDPAALEVVTDDASAQEAAPAQPSPSPVEEATSAYQAQLALARKHKRGTPAASAYQRALEINPQGAEALAELGFLMLQRGRNAEAAELARRATEVDPSSSLAWITLGSALQYLKDEEGAMSAYRNCVKHGRGRYVAECRAVLR